MVRFKPFLWLFLITCICSCASVSKFAPGISREDIDNIVLIRPVVEIGYIDSLRNYIDSTDLSERYISIIENAAKKSFDSIAGQTSLEDEYNEDVFKFFSDLQEVKLGKVWDVPVPDCLIKALDSQPYRFGLMIIGVGWDSEKRVLMDVILGGSRCSLLSAVIIDKQEKRIVFHNSNYSDTSPLNASLVNTQMKFLFHGPKQ